MTTSRDLPLLARRSPPGRMSFEEFLEWADAETLAEWVDGEVRFMPPTSSRDQWLFTSLIKVIGIWVEEKGLGEIRAESFAMRLSGRVQSGRVPDFLFVAREHLDRLGPTYLDGPADLVVDIVSPDSVDRDRREKLGEYEEGGVPEYWILDPIRQWADFYELGPDGRYQLALGGGSGVYRSRALGGFPLDVEWLWQQPLPNALDVLRRLGLLST